MRVLPLDSGREIDEALVVGLGHVSSFPNGGSTVRRPDATSEAVPSGVGTVATDAGAEK
ncbi:hypothetical protein GCM10027162_40190 [Streptomyces incanus]